MQKGKKYKFSVRLNAAVDFLHVATSFVEQSADSFGLTRSDSMCLGLATEEIFVYLCGLSHLEHVIEISCTGGGWFVMVDFSLPVDDFNLRAFNITSTAAPDDDAFLEEMGLFLASRQVDRFQVTESENGGISLSLIKEKKYPAIPACDINLSGGFETYSIRKPDSDEIKFLVALAHEIYSVEVLPGSFEFPGKVVDMFEMGDYDALIAAGPSGLIGGGIIFQWSGLKTVEFFGPYVFNQTGADSGAMAKELIHACISAIAKTHAVALINRLAVRYFPKEEFEILGTLDICNENGVSIEQPTYFRQMQEDTGCTVKSHPDLADFLQSRYKSLFLPREILIVTDAGEQQTSFSVITADFDKSRDIVTLKPVRSGCDTVENLKKHVIFFEKQSVCNLFFELDLSLSWQMGFTPALLKNGFVPKLVLPYAGRGDIVIFQWEGHKL